MSTRPNPGASNPARKNAPASKPAPASREEPASRDEAAPTRRPHGEQPVLDQATKYGLLATLGLGLVVAIVVLFVSRNKAADRRAREAYEAEVTQVHRDLQGLDLKDATAAERLIKVTEEKRPKWIDHDLAAEIESLMARARSNLTSAKEKREALERFDEIEGQLKQSDLATERLKDLRRQLDESEARLADGGAELTARFGLARLAADKQYATRLVEEARAFAKQGGTNARPSLVRYQGVEDELKTLLDRAFTAKNKELQDFYTLLYKQVIEETDKLANALFQAEGESLAWTDCLAPPQDKYWNASSARGFSGAVVGGVFRLIGPDQDSGRMAVISIGDREQWRHFQVDIEFTVEKGDIDMFFRLGKGPNTNTLSYPLKTTGDGILVAGKKYSARISAIGSKFNVRFAGEDIDTPLPREESVSWVMNRKGAIGFVVSPEARANFTRFRVRELR